MRTLAALGFAAALAGLTSSHWRRQAQPAALSEVDGGASAAALSELDEASAAASVLPESARAGSAEGGACASCAWPMRSRDATRSGRASASVFGARARANASSPSRARAWRHATGARVQSSPVVGDDGAVYFGSGDGHVYAVGAADGALRWRRPTGS